MKLLKPFNLIMFVLIPIIMFFGFSLYSYASTGTVSISQTTGTAKAQFSGINGYYTIGGGTGYSDDMYTKISSISLTVKSSASATFTRPLSVELHLVTTEGDFLLTGNKVHSLSTTAVSIMGTGYGTSFQGVPVGYYCVVDYQTSTNVTITIAGSFTWETEHDNQEYWFTTINGHVVDTMENTETIISMLENLGDNSFTYVNSYTLKHNSNVTYPIRSSILDYTFQLSSSSTATVTYTGTFDYCTIYNYISLVNGNMVLITDPYTYFPTSSSGSFTIPLNISSQYAYLESSPMKLYSFITIYGGDGTKQINPSLTNAITVTPYKKNIENNWDTIGSSQELTDLNNTSDSVDSIISDNNTFESSAFTDFSDNLEEFGFDDWSLVPIAADLTTTKNIITMFYNILPFKVQWLFNSVMALGLIVMLLTVGTRVVQRTGDFTRAKPVKMKDSSRRKG